MSRSLTITTFNLDEDSVRTLLELFPFQHYSLDDGIKYLGSRLKPNSYRKEDLNWLLAKLEVRVNTWCNRWLSREGRLILVKMVLEAIQVYWMALAWIPKSILNKTKRIYSNFLWTGKKDQRVLPWVKWDQIARPKGLGGWGLKKLLLFEKSLAAKVGWRLISTHSIWTEVIIHKYIAPTPILYWIRDLENTNVPNGSIIWKALCNTIPLIQEGLAWKVGDGVSVRIGADPWPRSH